MSKNISRNNHFLSQMYLEGWATNKKVEVYECRVPNSNVPMWQTKSIKGIGSYDSMYVRLKEGEETDDIEKYFCNQFETPAKRALTKARGGEHLTKEEWDQLIRFAICHMVRSPKFIEKTIEIGIQIGPQVLEDLKKEVEEESIKKSQEEDEISPSFRKLFPMQIEKVESDEKSTTLKVETIIGKQFYLWFMFWYLKDAIQKLQNHKWAILTLDSKVSLPTTDNPVAFLNYKSLSDYTLEDTWDKEGVEIYFPLSPNRILYCAKDKKYPRYMQVDKPNSFFLKGIIIENAYRKIISNKKDPEVPLLMPRIIDEKVYQEEKEKWANFQKIYLKEESKYIN